MQPIKTEMLTQRITKSTLDRWAIWQYQRPLRENQKVRKLADVIRREGAIPGVIVLGRVNGDPTLYRLDGQHRLHAFGLADVESVSCDVRICHFNSAADMGAEYIRINSQLVPQQSDDRLRAISPDSALLTLMAEACPFVSFGRTAQISASAVIRSWIGSNNQTPNLSAGSVHEHLESIEDTEYLIDVLTGLHAAWGLDRETRNLWRPLNLVLCFWLWRRVVSPDRPTGSGHRSTQMSGDMFTTCMRALSANVDYCAYLVGRRFGDRDRGRTYEYIKKLVVARYKYETGMKPVLPQPPWASKR
jgi:hypothetical protein